MTTGTKVSGAHRTQGLGNAQLENKTKQNNQQHTQDTKKKDRKKVKSKKHSGAEPGAALPPWKQRQQ